MMLSNGIVDVIVYSSMDENFQKFVAAVFCRALCCREFSWKETLSSQYSTDSEMRSRAPSNAMSDNSNIKIDMVGKINQSDWNNHQNHYWNSDDQQNNNNSNNINFTTLTVPLQLPIIVNPNWNGDVIESNAVRKNCNSCVF